MWEGGLRPSGRVSGVSRSGARTSASRSTRSSTPGSSAISGSFTTAHPFVIPTLYGRIGNKVYVHGSSASRMLRTLKRGVDACLTVTLVDGLVLARSIFNHSINYRSVVVLGRAVEVEGADEKLQALEAFSDRILPGRWADVRPPTATELKATSILRLPLDEASAKVRVGPPKDDEEDYEWPVWAGVIPLALRAGEPHGGPSARVRSGAPRSAPALRGRDDHVDRQHERGRSRPGVPRASRLFGRVPPGHVLNGQ